MTCFYLAFLSVSFFAHIPLKLNLNWLRLACLCLFWNLELFWRNNKTMLNSAFVGYEKFCSSYPNQPHSIVANHSTVADIRGQPFDFWEGWGGMGNLFFPQTSDHIIFFPWHTCTMSFNVRYVLARFFSPWNQSAGYIFFFWSHCIKLAMVNPQVIHYFWSLRNMAVLCFSPSDQYQPFKHLF